MRNPENIREVSELIPDFMGFIFYPPSPRSCSSLPVNTVRSLPEGIMPVAVTVNSDFDRIMGIVDKYGFKGVQLHAEESPEMCLRLREEGLFVMKAISVRDSESMNDVRKYVGKVDLFVFDTATKSRGGSGKKFDWSLLENYDTPTDFLLSGGIGPEDADRIIEFSHPHFVGVDLNSRFEVSPGVKSISLLSRFLNELKEK